MKKIIFRILGALSSSLIIVSVFVPFVSVSGNNVNLWETYSLTNSLYLPIMIIIFGAIGTIFFLLNVKTEFAYMSTGAISFFVVMRTIDIINQDAFNTLSVGYYFLTIGALLTGIMAFLTNLKTNLKEEKTIAIQEDKETSVLDQIDKLYNDNQLNSNQISSIQPVDNSLEPLPIQPIEVVNEEKTEPVVQSNIEPIRTIENTNEASIPSVNVESNAATQDYVVSVNPVIQEFQQINQNPVVQEFAQPVNSMPTPIQTETNQVFSTPLMEPVNAQIVPPVESSSQEVVSNPVIQEFTNSNNNQISQNNEVNSLDIFGQ